MPRESTNIVCACSLHKSPNSRGPIWKVLFGTCLEVRGRLQIHVLVAPSTDARALTVRVMMENIRVIEIQCPKYGFHRKSEFRILKYWISIVFRMNL
jgi:hypothetical protein